MKTCAIILLVVCCVIRIQAQSGEEKLQKAASAKKDTLKHYTTQHLGDTPPVIDGKLDDIAWNNINWGGGDFIQLMPDKGKKASVQTKFKILYDDKNLYVAVKCLDPEPEKIVKRMSRRDSFEGDMVEINLDTYYDKRTAFSFTASVSGVKGDEYVSNNGDNWDPGWDPIWYLATSIDAEGWNAEFRIPLSQLRFTNKEELVWGLELTRIFFRKQERSIWQYIPPDAGGWVHLFGELDGIKGIKPQKQLEIQPFVVAQTESFQKEVGNPYQTGKYNTAKFGLDAKIGITSDITLDLTVNPDFGQVEADPSQVNLSAFELFFQERRPFFIEGNNTLNFPVGQLNNNNLFYSRRIGRPPQSEINTDPNGEDNVNEFVKPNRYSTILGAAKITGKNKKGFSWGILESVTEKEYAEVDSLGHKHKQPIEPLTNYFVARAQQDISKGNTIVGAMFTATNRRITDRELEWLHKNAYSGGVDFLHHWKKRKYYVSARSSFSHVNGTAEAIKNTQLSSERFFQRPDNHHTTFDSTRTSLSGTAGQLLIGKKGGDLVGDLGLLYQSPQFELNDLGYMAQTDNINQWLWMQYRILEVRGITRRQRYNINQWKNFDFGKRSTGEGYNVNAHTQFTNYWSIGGGMTWQMFTISNADLRGGPSIRYPGGRWIWSYVSSDNRKKLYGEVFGEIYRGDNDYAQNNNIGIDLIFQPINALNLSVSTSFSKNKNDLQWVNSTDETGQTRYIVGTIDQTTARISIRMTYMVTPNLSIQYWGQPFGTSGTYRNFKTINDAGSETYTKRFTAIGHERLALIEDEYHVDEDGNGMRDFGFSRPDFNFGQFRSNMVIRWEYIPGSTVFLVWTQERNGEFYNNVSGERNFTFNFQDKAHNIFLLKFTYRFVL